jgi:hypothetical protein
VDDDFLDESGQDKDRIDNVKNLEDQGSVAEIEHQVKAQEGKHSDQGEQGREEQDAFQQVSFQQGDETAL